MLLVFEVGVGDGGHGGDHLIAEEPELLPSAHGGEFFAVHFVADVADGAVHHVGHVGGGEDGWVEAAKLLGRVVGCAHYFLMVLNVVTVQNSSRVDW